MRAPELVVLDVVPVEAVVTAAVARADISVYVYGHTAARQLTNQVGERVTKWKSSSIPGDRIS